MRKRQPRPRSRNATLRIIGGDWRRRQLSFPELEGLRPTPDRVRETLFNWLAPTLPGSRCLDLFAGSGALGLEALSRGAGAIDFVEMAPAAARALQQNLDLLKANNGRIHNLDALAFLNRPPEQPYDLIFLDPPFRKGWLGQVIERLDAAWVRDGGYVYVEHEQEMGEQVWPEHWRLHRQKRAGQVVYSLFEVSA
ncbi:16S rRNA (guanine(966)-N(2))-methyltransferase RsmD [Marinobacteraceae bacterium S3BR75-40.1]